MAGEIGLSVGTKLYVAVAEPATYDVAGFAALSFTEVGEVTNIGEFGGTATITQHIPLSTGVVKKRKGSIDYGTASIQIGRLVGDSGQDLLKDGFDGGEAYTVHSFKMEDDERIAYFTGLVGSFTTVTNDANSVTAINCNLELDNSVVTDDSAVS